MISPDKRRQAVEQVQTVMDVSERRVCRVLGQPRSTQRYKKRVAQDEEILCARMVVLASEYGRYGYRRITAMLRGEGWQVNHKRVERLWRREGLKVPAKQPKRGEQCPGSHIPQRQRNPIPPAQPAPQFRQSHTQKPGQRQK